MSLTGTGLDVRTSGGSFSGKKVSLKFLRRELQSPCSVPVGISRLNSGCGACGGCGSNVAICYPRFLLVSQRSLGCPFKPYEHSERQFRCPANLKFQILAHNPLTRCGTNSAL